MDRYTHIVPVGHTPETLISSIRESMSEYPLTKVVFILGLNEDDESEKKARRVADEVEKSIGLVTCERMYTNLFDVLSAANDLVVKARQEAGLGNKVVFNLSGSLRTIDIAGYIASLVTGSSSCVGVPDYKGDKPVGIREVYPIPEIPIEKLTKIKVEVLKLLDVDEWKSLDTLSKDFDRTSKIQLDSKKSKISFHLNSLRKARLVETRRDNKILYVRLSKLGLIYRSGLG